MSAIFRDDSNAADKRAAALARLMALCPSMLRPLMEPHVADALSRATDADIAALMLDVDGVVANAQGGNIDAIIATAKKYGATDAQIMAFTPAVTGETADPMAQFAAFLPKG